MAMYQSNPRIAELILARGKIAGDAARQQAAINAEAARNSGQIWGSTIAGLGRSLGDLITDIPKARALEAETKRRDQIAAQQLEAGRLSLDEAKQQADERNQFRSAFGAEATRTPGVGMPGSTVPGPPTDEAFAAAQPNSVRQRVMARLQGNPEWQEKAQTYFDKQDQRTNDLFADAASMIWATRGDPETIQHVMDDLVERGINPDAVEKAKAALADPQTAPNVLRQFMSKSSDKNVLSLLQPKLTEFDPTKEIRDAQGNLVRAAKPKEEKAPATGSFEDYTVRRFGPNPTPGQIEQARKDYQQADDRPIVVRNEPTQWVMRNGKAIEIPKGSSQPGDTPFTATGFEQSIKGKRAEPVLAAVAELSEKINTQQGVIAKISGGAARQAARINLDNDVAEYEAIISAFTPLVARALGHTGVLTELDVQSAKALFPRPGDSKELRDRKINRLNSLLGSGGAYGAPDSSAKPAEAPAAPKSGAKTIGRFKVEIE
jgi:hypothetical protein